MAGGMEENVERLGRQIILASSFIGSPRHMRQQYQDAMAICRQFGKPDFFITFTCNPRWPEILDALYPGQQPEDAPHIVSRVFHLKLHSLLNILTTKGRPRESQGFRLRHRVSKTWPSTCSHPSHSGGRRQNHFC